ncbi:MAG: metallophosphoesterase [Clostridia bacterium]|nr:metallophosphoesterase [Clostridia bacterium]
MKKVISVLLALVMVFACSATAFAAPELPILRFDENGEFKILHITDCQDVYPANQTMVQFITHCLNKYDPDLVVLGGDNCVDDTGNIEKAIAEIAKIFVDNETYFTLVFGNHDREGGHGENDVLLSYYQKAGGKYCLAYDQVPSLTGVATHNLPIFASDSLDVAYNLYMFDSGTSGYSDPDRSGQEGYDCVHEDQVNWFKTTNSAYTLLNGGKVIPSMAFQHIIVGEIMDVFYKEKSEVAISFDSKFCNGKEYDLTVADFSAIKDGMLTEPPCPGVENYGQFDALVEQGTVAVFSGHDHVNTFTVEYKGVDIVNTAGCTFHSYGQDYNRGGRLITLHEGETEYDSQVLLLAEEAMDSDVIELNFFSKIFGVLINKIILAFFNLF